MCHKPEYWAILYDGKKATGAIALHSVNSLGTALVLEGDATEAITATYWAIYAFDGGLERTCARGELRYRWNLCRGDSVKFSW